MQPCMNATVPRFSGARVTVTLRSGREPAFGGASESIERRRALGTSGASFGPSLAPGASTRSRFGWVRSAKMALR
jgi:hypothetical protein